MYKDKTLLNLSEMIQLFVSWEKEKHGFIGAEMESGILGIKRKYAKKHDRKKRFQLF